MFGCVPIPLLLTLPPCMFMSFNKVNFILGKVLSSAKTSYNKYFGLDARILYLCACLKIQSDIESVPEQQSVQIAIWQPNQVLQWWSYQSSTGMSLTALEHLCCFRRRFVVQQQLYPFTVVS